MGKFNLRPMIETYTHGVKIVDFGTSQTVYLCSDCFGPLLDQIGGWENIDSGKMYPLIEEKYYRNCSLCRRPIAKDRRGGTDRRVFDYSVHLPERRKATRRMADLIAQNLLNRIQA